MLAEAFFIFGQFLFGLFCFCGICGFGFVGRFVIRHEYGFSDLFDLCMSLWRTFRKYNGVFIILFGIFHFCGIFFFGLFFSFGADCRELGNFGCYRHCRLCNSFRLSDRGIGIFRNFKLRCGIQTGDCACCFLVFLFFGKPFIGIEDTFVSRNKECIITVRGMAAVGGTVSRGVSFFTRFLI